MPEFLVGLVPLAPWLGGAFVGLEYLRGVNGGDAAERSAARAASLGSGLALLLMVILDLWAVTRGASGQVRVVPWLVSGDYQVWISFTLDALSLSLATIVALVGFLTVRFSVGYMHREAGFQRFFLLLSLFIGAMLLLVLAGNAVLAFAGWELAGVSSYLLIGYAFDRKGATQNAVRAFVTNRFGDAAFVMGIFLAFASLGGTEWPAIAAGAQRVEGLEVGLVALAFVVAALAKSAQVPFAPWILRALEGPTPSSAIFYGSLMVHAGVYLVIRLAPLVEQTPAIMAVLALFGLLTAIYGYLAGLTQTDVKGSLMLSTLAQAGLMFLACGLGAFTLAAWYLGAHALWRSYQFLSAPGLMHQVSAPQRPAARWLTRSRRLYTASLQRFWLEALVDGLLVRPTERLAQDVKLFDERVVHRLVGQPEQDATIASLADWEGRKSGAATSPSGLTGAQGAVGGLLLWLASVLYWFEERLVLRGGGEALGRHLRRMGHLLEQVDDLLSQPRYLLLMIAATFVVIL